MGVVTNAIYNDLTKRVNLQGGATVVCVFQMFLVSLHLQF